MAHTIPILTRTGERSGEVTLPASLFGVEPNERLPLFHPVPDLDRSNLGSSLDNIRDHLLPSYKRIYLGHEVVSDVIETTSCPK